MAWLCEYVLLRREFVHRHHNGVAAWRSTLPSQLENVSSILRQDVRFLSLFLHYLHTITFLVGDVQILRWLNWLLNGCSKFAGVYVSFLDTGKALDLYKYKMHSPSISLKLGPDWYAGSGLSFYYVDQKPKPVRAWFLG
jgi:hypothetical protein